MTGTAVNLTIASNGRLVIPAPMRAQLGLEGGDKLLARVVQGALVLEPIDAAVRRAQAMVAHYAPSRTDVVDELIAERRVAAEHE